MAKTVVVSTIKEHLQWWMEGFDPKQLEVNTRKGELFLSDLRFRKDAFKHILGHDTHLIAGCVGKLQAKWSWSGLFSSPVHLEVSGLELDVGIGPEPPVDASAKSTAAATTEATGKKRRGRSFFAKGVSAAAGAVKAAVKPSRMSRMKQQAVQRVTDRLIFTVASLRVGMQCNSQLGFGMVLETAKLHGDPQNYVQHTQADVKGLGFFINPHLERSSPLQREYIVEPMELEATAVRTSGRRFKDWKGIELRASLKSVRLGWSDEQCTAIMNCLTALGLLDKDHEGFRFASWKPHAAEKDEAEDDELLTELSTADAALLQEGDTPLEEGAVFKAHCEIKKVVLAIGKKASAPVVGAEAKGQVSVILGEKQRQAECRMEKMKVAEWELLGAPGGRRMLRFPRHGSAHVLDLKCEQQPPDSPSLVVNVMGPDLCMLPRWGEVLEVLQETRARALELVRSIRPRPVTGDRQKRLLWDVTIRSPSVAIPADPHDLQGLSINLNSEKVTCSLADNADMCISFRNCVAAFMREGKDRKLFKDIDVNLDRKGDSAFFIESPSVIVGLTISQLDGLAAILRSLHWMRSAKVEGARSWSAAAKLGGLRLVVVDSEGVAANLAVMVSASTAETFPDDAGRQFWISGFKLALVGSDGPQTLLKPCDIQVSLGEVPEMQCKLVKMYSTVYTLFALKLFLRTLSTAWRSAPTADASQSVTESHKAHQGGRAVFESIVIDVDDPDGLSLSVSFSSLVLCRDRKLISFRECDITIVDVALLRIMGTTQAPAQLALGAVISVSAALSIYTGQDLAHALEGRIAHPTLQTEGPVECSVLTQLMVAESMSNPKTFEDGEIRIGKIVLNASDGLVREVAEVCGEVLGNVRHVIDSRSAVFHNARFGLKMAGPVVEEVSGEVKRKGILPGCTILSVGQEKVESDDDVLELLEDADLPVPVQFIAPTQKQEIFVDLIIQPFTLNVQYFATQTGVEVRNVSVLLGEVPVRAWRGTPSELGKVLHDRYVMELTKNMPWLSASVDAAKDIVGQKASKAVEVIRSKVAVTGVSLGETGLTQRVGDIVETVQTSNAKDFGRGVANIGKSAIDGGRQVGDTAAGIMAWSAGYFGLEFEGLDAPAGIKRASGYARASLSSLPSTVAEAARTASEGKAGWSAADFSLSAFSDLAGAVAAGAAAGGAAAASAAASVVTSPVEVSSRQEGSTAVGVEEVRTEMPQRRTSRPTSPKKRASKARALRPLAMQPSSTVPAAKLLQPQSPRPQPTRAQSQSPRPHPTRAVAKPKVKGAARKATAPKTGRPTSAGSPTTLKPPPRPTKASWCQDEAFFHEDEFDAEVERPTSSRRTIAPWDESSSSSTASSMSSSTSSDSEPAAQPKRAAAAAKKVRRRLGRHPEQGRSLEHGRSSAVCEAVRASPRRSPVARE